LAGTTQEDLLGAVVALHAVVLAGQADHTRAALDDYEVVLTVQNQFLKVTAQPQTALVTTGLQASPGVHLEVLHFALALI